MKSHWDGQGWSTGCMQRDWRNWVCSAWERDTFLQRSYCFLYLGNQRIKGRWRWMLSGSAWWWLERQRTQIRTWWIPVLCKERGFLLWKLVIKHLNRCPEKLRVLCPWRCSKLSWTGLVQPDLGLLWQGVGLHDLWRSPPTSIILWLYGNSLALILCSCFISALCAWAEKCGCDWMTGVQKRIWRLLLPLISSNAYRNRLEKVQLQYNTGTSTTISGWGCSSEVANWCLITFLA